MSDFKVEPFVNMFGQSINPGDDVIYAGTSWKSTTFRKGKFAGNYYQKVRRSVLMRDSENNPILDDRGYRKYETKESYEIVAVKVSDVSDTRWKWNEQLKRGEDLPVVRTAILPLKRVFKLDTGLAELENSSF